MTAIAMREKEKKMLGGCENTKRRMKRVNLRKKRKKIQQNETKRK